jgi:hypothetical protein
MPGLMSRILSRRANGAPLPAPVPPDDQPTAVVPAPDAAPAGTAAAAAAENTAPTTDDAAAIAAPPPADSPTEVVAAAEAGAPAAPAAPADPPTEVVAAAGEATPAPAPDAPVAAAADDPALADLPAGAEPVAPATPSFKDRGKLRRRLRYLRSVRELGFRDLGGLVFDLDRFGRDRPDLVRAKLDALGKVDAELRVLEVAIDDVHEIEEIHEPGISACAHCGALHGSDARYCPSCGVAVEAPRAVPAGLPTAPPEQPSE